MKAADTQKKDIKYVGKNTLSSHGINRDFLALRQQST